MSTRMTEPTPKWWKKVKVIGISVVAIAGTILTMPAAGVTVPLWLITGSQYAIAIGAALGITAQTGSTKRDKN